MHKGQACSANASRSPCRAQTKRILLNQHFLAQARPEVQIVQRGGSITVADVQALVLWVLAEGANPKWAFVRVSIACHRGGL